MATSPLLRLTGGLSDVAHVGRQFPVPVAVAGLFTLYFLLDLHKVKAWPDDVRLIRVPVILIASFLWTTNAALWVQSRDRPPLLGHIAGVAGAAAIAILVSVGAAIDLAIPALLAALAIGLGLAPYLRPRTGNAPFWLFNHNAVIGTLLAGVAVVLFAGGVSAIIETLKYLFGLDLPNVLHEKVWSLAGGFIGPVYALSLIPDDLDQPVIEGEQTEFTSRSTAVLVKVILVPLLLVYAAILHVYAVKILIDLALPKGRLGWMVLSYGAVIALTALAAFPTRDSGGPAVRVFWRVWPWLLLVPTALLFIAVGARIRAYGVTEARYLVVLAGLWFLSLVVTQGLLARRDLRLVPGVLGLLLLLSSLGPWGVMGWSVRSQAGDLRQRLASAGLLKDGRIDIDPRQPKSLGVADRVQLHAVITYLWQHQRLDMLRPLFAGIEGDPFAVTAGRPIAGGLDTALADRIRARLAIGRPLTGPQRYFNFYAVSPASADLPWGGAIAGPFNLNPRTPSDVAGARPLKITLDDNMLTIVETTTAREARFDLNALSSPGGALGFEPQGAEVKPAGSTAAKARTPVHLSSRTGDLAVDVVVTNATANSVGDRIVITHLAFWIVLGP